MTETILTTHRDSTITDPIPGVGDFVQLLKPRVMSLVVFTGLVGLVIAPGALHPVLSIVAILCIAVGSGAAGAINMWYDRDIDAIMERTANRPIPAELLRGSRLQSCRIRGRSRQPDFRPKPSSQSWPFGRLENRATLTELA